MSFKEEMEAALSKEIERQLGGCDPQRKWSESEQEFYKSAFVVGALWAAKSWAERYSRLKWLSDPTRTLEECHKFKPERIRLWDECAAAAKEVEE